MGNHLDIKHKIQKIDKRSTFDEILNESMLNDKEKATANIVLCKW